LSRGTALWVGKTDQPLGPMYVDDFAHGLAELGENDAALGNVWHLPTPPPTTAHGFLELLSAEARRPIKAVRLGTTLVAGSAWCGPSPEKALRCSTNSINHTPWTPASIRPLWARAVSRRMTGVSRALCAGTRTTTAGPSSGSGGSAACRDCPRVRDGCIVRRRPLLMPLLVPAVPPCRRARSTRSAAAVGPAARHRHGGLHAAAARGRTDRDVFGP
jgi:hypothetical protein